MTRWWAGRLPSPIWRHHQNDHLRHQTCPDGKNYDVDTNPPIPGRLLSFFWPLNKQKMNMGWATHSSSNAFSLVIQYYDVILQYQDDHHLWFGALYGMFDALNGHFGDDVEWVMVAYPPIIINICKRNFITA